MIDSKHSISYLSNVSIHLLLKFLKFYPSHPFYILIILLFGTSCFAGNQSLKIEDKYRVFFRTYCTECHNAKKTKGKLRLDKAAFSFEIEDLKSADIWQKILDAVQSSEMPPEDATQPRDKTKLAFLEMLSQKMVEARSNLSDSAGKIVMRRLNRREYKNTLKELLGVNVDVSNLPDDHSSSNFDTNGSSLFMSSDQIEQYLEIARSALNKAFNENKKTPSFVERYEPEVFVNEFIEIKRDLFKTNYENAQRFRNAKESNPDPKKYHLMDARAADIAEDWYKRYYKPYEIYLQNPQAKTGALLSLGSPFTALEIPTYPAKDKKLKPINSSRDHPRYHRVKSEFPDGLYKIKIRAAKFKDIPADRSFMDLGFVMRDGYVRHHTFQVTAPLESPEIVECLIRIENGRRNIALQEKTDSASSPAKQELYRKAKGLRPAPSIWIDWIEWEGPIEESKPQLIDTIVKNTSKTKNMRQEEVKKILTAFAKTAFRGESVESNYIKQLMTIYKQKLNIAQRTSKAIIEPMAIILASPSFLYLSEPSADSKETTLKQLQLANRLAYFLWNSPPDSELLRLASRNSLSGKTLSKQVDRLLKDPRADNFYRSFTYQWLGLERLSFFQFDASKYPHFDASMKIAAENEVYETVKTIILNNLGSQNLIKSDFVVINGLMAQHYQIPNVTGDEFRKVTLPKKSIRGGLVGMAAVMAMGSDGNHTSPVERGAWILRKILDQPPPPAPANVPQLSRLEGKSLTAEQMLKVHQEEPQCSHCHKKIDPIGLGLENFDATGIWRTHYTLNDKDSKIESKGAFYKGKSFRDYYGYREVLYQHLDDFNRGLIKNLLSYSLGRKIGFSDQPTIESLQKSMKKNKNSIRELIHEIVQSKVFRVKK